MGPQGPVSPSNSGCSPVLTTELNFEDFSERCSLLEQYPDLQVVDSGHVAHNPLRDNITLHKFASEVWSQPEWPSQLQSQSEPISQLPDQGYLAMGPSVNNISLDLPGSGLEPMSNSLLNGLLDKQLDEVYMQHLTDNLARCNSHLGNSLLHGLVPPPQPSGLLRRTVSLEASLVETSGGESGKEISYLSTHNLVPCSSYFSSPVLRISEADNTHLK